MCRLLCWMRPAIENMKHFCFLPGTIYADKVIVQSEGMKQIYIDEYIKVAEERGIEADREQLEEKFVGSGYPKYEKERNVLREELEIPEEWMKVIQKPDGSWKKIVLYKQHYYRRSKLWQLIFRNVREGYRFL